MKDMKRIIILLVTLMVVTPAFAQVGRFKNIKVVYPGYSLKLDTATGELTAVHYDDDSEILTEEIILKKQSHNHRQIGRYEFRRTRHIGVYQIFDTGSGNYTTVKWRPKDADGKEIEADINSAVNDMVDGLKKFLNKLEDGLEKAHRDTSEVTI